MAKILIMRYAPILTNTVDQIIDIYEVNAKTQSSKRALLLHKMSLISEMMLIAGVIAYMCAIMLHFINPIYAYFWRHEFQALLPLYIPFIDEKTTNGFILLTSIQTVEMCIAIIATACGDFPFMILVVNVFIFSTIFKDHVNELNAILRKKEVDLPLAKAKLQNIFELYTDIRM